jgi:hypothetical protein
MATDKLQVILERLGTYNDPNGSSIFPHWEGMVRGYVQKLALNKLV